MDPRTSPPFHWSQIESEDYRQYLANLRAIGCPEETIRDLVFADVVQKDVAKAASIWRPPPRREYWQKPKKLLPGPAEKARLEDLASERDRLLVGLLGETRSDQEFVDLLWLQVHGPEAEVLFLPPDRQEVARKALTDAGIPERERAAMDSHLASAFEDLWKEKAQALAPVLTSAEWNEYRLRYSPSAQGVRWVCRYFSCTRAEFESLLTACETAAAATGNPIRDHVAAQGYRLFGERRGAELERVSDPSYSSLRRVLAETGQPESLADEAWTEVKSARERLGQISQDPHLSIERRAEHGTAFRTRVEERLVALLGPLASYVSAWWLRPPTPFPHRASPP